MQETQVQSLGQEDALEEEMATHSSILAWEIPWTEEPGRLQSTGLQRVGHNWVTKHIKIECLHCTWHCVKHFTSIIDYFKIHCLKAPNTALLLTHTQHAPTWEPCCSDMFFPRPSTWLPHFIQASHQIPPLIEVTTCHSLFPALPYFLHGPFHYVLLHVHFSVHCHFLHSTTSSLKAGTLLMPQSPMARTVPAWDWCSIKLCRGCAFWKQFGNAL